MERKRIGKWVLSVLLWFWTGGVYFFGEVIWKTSQGRPETISWTMFALAIILAVPLERFGAELPWGMPLVGQACICAAAITALEFVKADQNQLRGKTAVCIPVCFQRRPVFWVRPALFQSRSCCRWI